MYYHKQFEGENWPSLSSNERFYSSDRYQSLFHVRMRNRDVAWGSEKVKSHGRRYLKPYCYDSDCESGYSDYNEAALFVPYVNKYLRDLAGALTRKDPTITGLTLDQADQFFTGSSVLQTVEGSITEFLKTDLVMLWADIKPDGRQSVIRMFSAEHVLNHEYDNSGNVSYVLLKQVETNSRRVKDVSQKRGPGVSANNLNSNIYYLELFLDSSNRFTVQRYTDKFVPEGDPRVIISRGRPLSFLPISIMERGTDYPLITDMANLNLNHYNNTAWIQLSTKFASFPIYAVPVSAFSSEESSYQISPNKAWEYDGSTSGPSVLEYFGRGRADSIGFLKDIEGMIVQSGARLTGMRDAGLKFESPEIFSILRDMEISDLMNSIRIIEKGIEKALSFARDLDFELSSVNGNIGLKVSKWALLSMPVTDRVLRTLSVMLEKGQITETEAYNNLQASGFIDPDMDIEDFKKSLKQYKDTLQEENLKKKQEEIELQNKLMDSKSRAEE